jgi:rRNA maturation RNase YbeY
MKEAVEAIHFHYLVPSFYFPNRSHLKKFLLGQLKREGKNVEAINFIFCNDEYLVSINQQYLNHDTFTDIITFEFSPNEQPLVSDIYISVERVKENAAQFSSGFRRELHRVIFHGCLHLAGYKDKSKADEMTMRSKENEWLDHYFVPRSTVSQ